MPAPGLGTVRGVGGTPPSIPLLSLSDGVDRMEGFRGLRGVRSSLLTLGLVSLDKSYVAKVDGFLSAKVADVGGGDSALASKGSSVATAVVAARLA